MAALAEDRLGVCAPAEPYTLLLSCPLVRANTVTRESLRVDYDRRHDRKPHRDDDENIGRAWLAATEKNPRIFDGSKFRLHRIALDAHGDVVIELGLTGYREYLGTNRLPAAALRQLEADGQADHANPRAHLSDALGCETVLLTADDQVVLLRRSSSVATHGGLHNGPSGHPEPARCGAGVEGAGAQGAAAAAAVVHELYDSVLQETHEETAVPRDALSQPQLIGCMADAVGKPDLLFLTRTSLDADGPSLRHALQADLALAVREQVDLRASVEHVAAGRAGHLDERHRDHRRLAALVLQLLQPRE